MSLWNTPAGKPFNPWPDGGPTFARLLAELRAADPDGSKLRAAIAAEREAASVPFSRPLTAAALHTIYGAPAVVSRPAGEST